MTRSPQARAGPLIGAVASGGVLAIVATIVASPPPLSRSMLIKAAILVALTAVAELIAIQVRHGDSSELLTLFELAVVADIVLLPASWAAIVSVTGLAIALAVQRRPPVKFIFNVGQYALGVVPAVALYHIVGAHFETTAGLVALLAGMAIFTVVNLLTISGIMSISTGRPYRTVLSEESGISLAMGIGNSAVGMVAVSLYLSRPALLPAVLAPALALHLAFRGWIRQKDLSGRMEEEKSKLERILEHSSEGIVLADGAGTVMLWSPSMERMTSVPAAEAIGKSLSYLLRGRGSFGEPVTVGASMSAEPVELEVITADGYVRWLRVQHGPGLDPLGALSFDVLVVTDVTRQREVDKLKDDFVSTVSHELRTPLTPIKGYASLLIRRGDQVAPERRVEALQSILERADHMGRLVEDLLLASRIGTGERRMPDVQRRAVDVGSQIEKVVRSFRTGHPHREFVWDKPEEALIAMADPLRVEQIVANLVSNAVKFSDEGAPVELRVEREGSQVVIHVADEGRGIPSEKIPEIFEKFKRLEDPLVMETGGAGLGLFIVQQLARAMGGAVSVDSVVGQGSTFSVTLPVENAATVPPVGRRATDRDGALGESSSGEGTSPTQPDDEEDSAVSA